VAWMRVARRFRDEGIVDTMRRSEIVVRRSRRATIRRRSRTSVRNAAWAERRKSTNQRQDEGSKCRYTHFGRARGVRVARFEMVRPISFVIRWTTRESHRAIMRVSSLSRCSRRWCPRHDLGSAGLCISAGTVRSRFGIALKNAQTTGSARTSGISSFVGSGMVHRWWLGARFAPTSRSTGREPPHHHVESYTSRVRSAPVSSGPLDDHPRDRRVR
jgi:hypothetical protein